MDSSDRSVAIVILAATTGRRSPIRHCCGPEGGFDRQVLVVRLGNKGRVEILRITSKS